MQVKTKFNVGDKVWTTSQRFNEEKDDFELVANSTPRIIDIINIWCDKDETEITYHTKHIDGSRDILYYNEENCFATKEQAEEYIRRTE